MPQPEPPDFTGQYNTALAPDETANFAAWMDQLSKFKKHDAWKELFDYDLAGAFKAGVTPDERGHLDDRFKKPNHATFSRDSIYSGQNGAVGGDWGQAPNKRWDYWPSATNLQYRSPDALKAYFGQVEPNSKLMLPKAGQALPLESWLGPR